MKGAPRVVVGALLVLLALAVFWLWRSPADSPIPGVADDETGHAPAEAETASRPRGPLDPPVIPAEGTPIDMAAPILVAHARAGHAPSACRLAFELLRCQFSVSMDSLREIQSHGAQQLASEGELEAAVRKDEATLAIAESANACRRVDPAVQGEAVAWLSQAARARNPYAMYLYATGEHYRFREAGFAATPSFDEWRRSAPGMMIAARDAGIPEAAAFLARAYSQDIGLAHALFPDDPLQADMHWQLQSLLGSGATTTAFPFMIEQLDPAQERESRERARRMHEDAFDGAVFPELSSSDMPYALALSGSPASSSCQGPAPRAL